MDHSKEDRFTETLRESVRGGVSGLAALAPVPLLAVLGAPIEVVLAYLVLLILVLAALSISRRRGASTPE